MEVSYTYTKDASCCPGENVTIEVKRVITADLSKPRPSGFICGHRADIESVINYKALSKRNGNTRQYSVKRVGLVGARSRLGQTVQAVGSAITPGNISRVRSPVRSRLYSALTPGLGSLPGRGIRGRERSHRCPEGYQYGGRFTDSELSTCGQQLFDFPSILGETIAAIRRSSRGVGAQAVKPTALGRGRDIADQRERRDPNRTIPRVGPANKQLQRQKVQQLIPQMGKPEIQAHRMIRRDGFDLEPVVTPAVLRTIPDNRDMEGATYMMSIGPEGVGGEELGLLSNTGVTNLTYVREDGTSVSIAKVRELTVGERRKLGRTVNAAMKREVGDDELSRLQYVSEETGDGIQVIEGDAARAPRPTTAGVTERAPSKAPEAPEPEAPESEKITSIDEALAHISQGGNLSDIAPSILEEVLREKNALEVTKKLVTTPKKQQYTIRDSKNNFEHLHAAFASEIQHHLGLNSPDVAFVGKGNKRRYLLQDAASTLDGGTVDRRKTVNNASPREITAMLIADIVTGIDKRLPTSLSTVSSEDKTRLVAIDNPSELIPLDKLEIRKAAQRRIEEMRSLQPDGIYGKYFDSLQAEQQKMVKQQLTRLIQRAETFDTTQFRQGLTRNGELTSAEKAHLAIIETIFDTRLGMLRTSLKRIVSMVGGR